MDDNSVEPVLSDSWVTLNFNESDEVSLNPVQFTAMEHLLHDAQYESSSSLSTPLNSNSLIDSPPRIISIGSSLKVSPQTSGISSPIYFTKSVQIEEALPKFMSDENNTDWVWDWSSQPTNTPPRESQFRHPKPKGTTLSLRNTEAMKYDFFSWNFLQILIPSVIVSNLLAFGIGFFLGQKVASISKNC